MKIARKTISMIVMFAIVASISGQPQILCKR